MKKPSIFLITTLLLSGCQTFTLQLMSRSDGKVYMGSAQKKADGQGTVQFVINDQTYSGNFSRTSSDQYLSFVSAYARDNKGNRASGSGVGYGMGSGATFMAILSNQYGDGMRCGLQGDRMSGTGGGMCVDSRNNVYDVIYNWSGGVF
jgi:uncharacterized protein YceK